MTAVVSVTGASNAGKTTFIERIVPELRTRGLLVGTVKHASHGFTADVPGSDSARHAAAGASPVLLTGPGGMALFSERADPLPVAVRRHLGGVDLVLVEGYGAHPGPKVLVHRREVAPAPSPPVDELLFVITDEPLGHAVEVAPSALDRAAELLVAHARHSRAGHPEDRHPDGSSHVRLQVDGFGVGLGDFASRMLAGVVRGAVSGLQGVPAEPAEIELRVKAR